MTLYSEVVPALLFQYNWGCIEFLELFSWHVQKFELLLAAVRPIAYTHCHLWLPCLDLGFSCSLSPTPDWFLPVMFMLLAGFLCFSFLVSAARTREYIAALLHSVCVTALDTDTGRKAC